MYLGDPKRPAIEAVMKHGVHPGARAFVGDRKQVRLSDTKGRENLMGDALKQLRDHPVFTSPTPIPPRAADEVLRSVLETAGCSQARDAVDQRA